MKTPLFFIVAAFAIGFSAVSLRAQSTWTNGAATGLWSAAANWSPSGVPSTGTHVIFDNTATPGSVSLGNTTRQPGSLNLSNTSGSYDIAPGGVSGTLRTSSIIVSSAGASNTISARVASAGGADNIVTDTVLSGAGTSTLNISGVIVDQSSVRYTGFSKTGSGDVTLSGVAANTYSGNSSVSAGTLLLSKTAGVAAISGTDRASGPAIDPTLRIQAPA